MKGNRKEVMREKGRKKRVRERKKQEKGVHVCMCVCVWERQKERRDKRRIRTCCAFFVFQLLRFLQLSSCYPHAP